MKVVFHDSCDWEPAQLVLKYREATVPPKERIQKQLISWAKSRDSGSNCPCSLSYLNVAISSDAAVIHLEQICEKCLHVLVKLIPAVFPEADALEVGYRNVVEPDDCDFLSVQGTEVEFEDGRKEIVSSFAISKSTISVRQFERFVEKTNYRTDAEQEGADETWYSNDFLVDLSPGDRDAHPVVFLSFNDVDSYCVANGLRLPTEAEWFAASVVDPVIYEERDAKKAIYRASRSNDSLSGIGDEYTATRLPDGKVIVRRGPKWARDIKWKERVRENRIVVDTHEFGFGLTFRVCRSSF